MTDKANVVMGLPRGDMSSEEIEARRKHDVYFCEARFQERIHWVVRIESDDRYVCPSLDTKSPIVKIPSKEFVTMASEDLLSQIKAVLAK